MLQRRASARGMFEFARAEIERGIVPVAPAACCLILFEPQVLEVAVAAVAAEQLTLTWRFCSLESASVWLESASIE